MRHCVNQFSLKTLLFFLFFIGTSLLSSNSYGQKPNIISIDTSEFPIIKGKIMSTDSNGTLNIVDGGTIIFRNVQTGEFYTPTFDSCSDYNPFKRSIVLSLDGSGSMYFTYDQIPVKNLELDFATRFVNAIDVNDTSLLAYHVYDDTLLKLIPFTNNKTVIQNFIPNTPYGFNNDFTAQMTNYPNGAFTISKQGPTKRIVILVTDGVWGILPQGDIFFAIQQCLKDSIEFYCVLLTTPRTNYSFVQSIEQITNATGGKIYNSTINTNQIIETIGRIQMDAFDMYPCTFQFSIYPACEYKYDIIAISSKYGVIDTFSIINPYYQYYNIQSSFSVNVQDTLYINDCDTLLSPIKINYKDVCDKPLLIDKITFNNKPIVDSNIHYSIKDIGTNQLYIHAHNSFRNFDTTVFITIIPTIDSNFITPSIIQDSIFVNDECSIDSLQITIQNNNCLPFQIQNIQSTNSGEINITNISNTDKEAYIHFLYTPKNNSVIDTFTISFYNGFYSDTVNVILRGNITNPLTENYIQIPDSVLMNGKLCVSQLDTIPIINTSCESSTITINGISTILQPHSTYKIPYTFFGNKQGISNDSIIVTYAFNDSTITRSIYISIFIEDTVQHIIQNISYIPFQYHVSACDSPRVPLIVYNTLCKPLIIDSISIGNNVFSIDQGYPVTIIDSALFNIQFNNPKIEGTYTSSITLHTPDFDTTLSYSIIVDSIEKIKTKIIHSNGDSINQHIISVVSERDIIVKNVQITLTHNSGNFLFKNLLYDYGNGIMDYVFINDSTITITYHYDEYTLIPSTQPLLKVIGDFYLGNDTNVVFTVTDFTINYKDSCEYILLSPINDSINYDELCGDDIIRKQFNNKNWYVISPNPNYNQEFIVHSNEQIKYKVYNSMGDVVFNGKTNVLYNNEFNSGLYIVMIENRTEVLRFIIVK